MAVHPGHTGEPEAGDVGTPTVGVTVTIVDTAADVILHTVPVALTVIEPVEVPWQVLLVSFMLTVGPVLLSIVLVAVAVQPLASLTVTV